MTTYWKMYLKRTIYECCYILRIPEPKIKWQPQNKFPTETLLSAVTGYKGDLTILLSNQFLYNDMTDTNLAFFICCTRTAALLADRKRFNKRL